MKRLTCYPVILAIAILLAVIANAQVGRNVTKHYEKNGLAFDYPASWGLTDTRTQGIQTVTLAPVGSATQIVLRVKEGPASLCDFQAESKKIADALTKDVATLIKAGASPRTTSVKNRIGTSDVDGIAIHGVINHKPATGDVYSLRLNRHFVSLVYVRFNTDERASSAWNTVLTTLRVEPAAGVLGTTTASSSEGAITNDALNGRALSLPKPGYPPIARRAHASGTISVQVTIDESGNVISAEAIEGHPLLRAVSVAAAKEAHFSPTKLCGEPVKVTGVITYNFVAQ